MNYSKFILSGEDKKLLFEIKNTLSQCGYVFLGYCQNPFNLLRHVRSYQPDLLIIEVCNKFGSLKPVLEVIDEEMLSACILILDSRSDEIFEYLNKTRITTYIAKPVFSEVVGQIADICVLNFKRLMKYEQEIKKLNESLEIRKIVEKAKWILVEKKGMTEAEAYNIIREKSRKSRLPMRNIAEAIILSFTSDLLE